MARGPTENETAVAPLTPADWHDQGNSLHSIARGIGRSSSSGAGLARDHAARGSGRPARQGIGTLLMLAYLKHREATNVLAEVLG